MAKSKYETHVLPYLKRIEQWLTLGATAKEVAKKLGISSDALREYRRKGENGEVPFDALAAAFASACEEPDDEVEASLFKRARGYSYVETTHEEKLDRMGNVIQLVKTVVREVPPDPTSAMFWLTNRRPERWKYKPQDSEDEKSGEQGVVVIPEVKGDA